MSVEGAFWSLGVVEAVEPKSGLTQEGLCVVWGDIPVGLLNVGNGVGEITLIGVATDHLKTGREGRERSVANVWIKEVVSVKNCQ